MHKINDPAQHGGFFWISFGSYPKGMWFYCDSHRIQFVSLIYSASHALINYSVPLRKSSRIYSSPKLTVNVVFHFTARQSQYTAYDGVPFGIRKVKDQPFYMRIAERMRDSVQNGFAIVMKPFVEVGQKITKNLGIGRSLSDPARKDLYIFMQNDGTKNAGQLNSDISAGDNKVRVKRNDDLFDVGGPQLYKNDKHDEETQFIEVVDVYGNNYNGHLQGYGKNKFQMGDTHQSADDNVQHVRRKRSLQQNQDFENLGEVLLQDIESDDSMEPSQRFGDKIRALIQNTDWTNTQCAKRVFCEVMLQQSSDDMALMEKKMRKFLPV